MDRALLIILNIYFVIIAVGRRHRARHDENPFAKYVLQAVRGFEDIILFDTLSIQQVFDHHDEFTIKSGTSWETLINDMNKASRSAGYQKTALQLHNTVEIGNLFDMLRKEGLSVGEAMSQAPKPFVITNGGGENWGLLSTGIGTRTAWWVNMTQHLMDHQASYDTVKSFLNSEKLILLVCSSHVDPLIGAHAKIISLPVGVRKEDAGPLFSFLETVVANNITKSTILLINNSGALDRSIINAQIEDVFNHTIKNSYNPSSNGDGSKHFYEQIAKAKFVLCPSGIGMDSFRIWESLMLGSIPIVESNAGLDRTYSNLPVLVVANYSQVTPQLLEEAYICFSTNAHLFRYSHLTKSHWLQLVNTAVIKGASMHVSLHHPFRNSHCDYSTYPQMRQTSFG